MAASHANASFAGVTKEQCTVFFSLLSFGSLVASHRRMPVASDNNDKKSLRQRTSEKNGKYPPFFEHDLRMFGARVSADQTADE